MNVRSKIELVVVIGVMLVKYWNIQSLYCADCTPSAIILGGITLLLAMALVRRSTWLALLLAVGAISSGMQLGKVFLSAPHAHSFTSDLLFTRDETMYLVFALCLLDLCFEWRQSKIFTAAAI
jgi:hypothetical protein